MKWIIALTSILYMHDKLLIEKLRPAKNVLNENVPYHFLHEEEPGLDGSLQQVNTIFLTGKECAFKCVMCDLWKNTLDNETPPGTIVQQLDYALNHLPAADVIKLYNSSNFFDGKAIPRVDYPAIIERLQSYKRVIVENHPKLCSDICLEFASKLNGKLEIAMGLETIHPAVLPKLNKQLTAEDFKKAAMFLRSNNIDVRSFVLLNPPYLTGKKENIYWAIRTVAFAFESGSNRCTIIPTRTGNGIMDWLHQQNKYEPPTLDALEEVVESCLNMEQGQVFADTWDITFLSGCPDCFEARKRRLDKMNTQQNIYPKIICHCHYIHA